MIETSCHCGAVRITLPALPETVTSCNCSVCRRLAGLWAYYPPKDVRVAGETDGYESGDRTLSLRRCKVCGCTTHWETLLPDYDRMGVNMRNLDPALLAAIPVRRLDGADTWDYLD